MKKRLLCIVASLLLLILPARAAEPVSAAGLNADELYAEKAEQFGLSDLYDGAPDEVQDQLGQADLTSEGVQNLLSWEKVVNFLTDNLVEALKDNMGVIFSLFALLIVMAIYEILRDSFNERGSRPAARLCLRGRGGADRVPTLLFPRKRADDGRDADVGLHGNLSAGAHLSARSVGECDERDGAASVPLQRDSVCGRAVLQLPSASRRHVYLPGYRLRCDGKRGPEDYDPGPAYLCQPLYHDPYRRLHRPALAADGPSPARAIRFPGAR